MGPAPASRCCLVVPACSERMLVKAQSLAVDPVMVDLEDSVAGAGHHLAAIVLPKVQSANEIEVADRVLMRLEQELDLRRDAIWVDALIETARGLVEVERIAAASPRLRALVFGPGDYAASIGAAGAFIGANAPSAAELTRARATLAALGAAGGGAVSVSGVMVDAASARAVAATLARAGADGAS